MNATNGTLGGATRIATFVLACGVAMASDIKQGQTVTSADGKSYILSFIVTPEAGETLKDFHLVSDKLKVKLPPSFHTTQPAKWNDGTMSSGSNQPAGLHWTAQSNGELVGPSDDSPGSGPQTFTVIVKKENYGW